MSIDKNQGNSAQSNAQAQAASPRQNQRYSLDELNSAFSGTVSRYGHSEQLTKWETAFRGFIDANKPHMDDLFILRLDAQKDMMPFSTLILAYPYGDQDTPSICAYSLVIEATGEPLADGIQNVTTFSGARSVPVKYVPSDLWSSDFIAKIVSTVASELTVDAVNVTPTGFYVIPTEANSEDRDTVRQIFLWGDNANSITASTIQGEPQYLNVAKLPTHEAIPKFNVTYHNEDLISASGLPIRQDVAITCLLEPNAQTNTSPLNAKQTVPITRATGYVEPLFAPGSAPQPVNQNGTLTGGTQVFAPLFVITSLNSYLGTNSLTTQLLALASTAVMTANGYAWAAAFNPKRRVSSANGDVALRDIGVIGYEWSPSFGQPPVGDRIDTRSNTFTESDYSNLILNSFQSNLIYAIDIPRGDEMFWLNEAFVAAANNGNPVAQREATELIVKAANVLCNGNFQWDMSKPIFQNVGYTMHFGYYTESDGTRRDIRNLSDRLAIRNLYAGNDPTVIKAWEATFDDNSQHEAVRLDQRYRILEGITGHKFKLKDTGPRLLIAPEFINQVVNGLVAAKFSVKPEGIESLQQQQTGFQSAMIGQGNVNVNNGLYQSNASFGGQLNNGGMFTRFN